MDEKLIRLNKTLTSLLRGFIYVAGINLLVVSILGYVFSYKDITDYVQNEHTLSRLISFTIITNISLIVFASAFIFGVCGKKFNLKNMVIIIIGVPVLIIALFGYVLSSEALTIAFDISFYLFLVLFIVAAFLGGMKVLLLIINSRKPVKEDISQASEK